MADGRVEHDRSRWRRARAGLGRHRSLELTWKLLVLLVGALLLLAGLVMLVTPGPGWLVLIAGLAILATEFDWAERLLAGARRHAKAAADRALDPTARKESLVIAGLVTVCIVIVGWWWITIHGLPAPITDAWAWFRQATGGRP